MPTDKGQNRCLAHNSPASHKKQVCVYAWCELENNSSAAWQVSCRVQVWGEFLIIPTAKVPVCYKFLNSSKPELSCRQWLGVTYGMLLCLILATGHHTFASEWKACHCKPALKTFTMLPWGSMEFPRCAAAPVFSSHVLVFYAPKLQLACMST